MKTIFFLVFALVFLFSECSAAVALALPNPLRKPNGCYEKDTGHMVANEEKNLEGKCYSAHCSSDGSINYIGCGKIGTSDPNCFVIPANLSKPYPACCPSIDCKVGTKLL